MLKVAVTGGIGSGKSAVTRLLAAHGAAVADADALAREAVAPGTEGEMEVLAAFGPDVATADGHLDRAALAAVVFADPAARGRLERIVHPRVERALADLVSAAPEGTEVFVYDVPLLAETGDDEAFDVVVVVEAPEEVRLERLAGRGVGREDALARMAHQADDEQRRSLADVVLDNAGDRPALARQVSELWVRLLDRARGGAPGR